MPGVCACVRACVRACLLSQLWRLPWHNQHKEVDWRITLDALPTAARLHYVDPCICGEPIPKWFHHFWSCPVAAGLLAVLSNHLASRGMLPILLLHLHVLLAQPPSSRLHVGIWRVVCLAAVCALIILGGQPVLYNNPIAIRRCRDRIIDYTVVHS